MTGREIAILVSISQPQNSWPVDGSKKCQTQQGPIKSEIARSNPLKGKKYHQECFSTAWQMRGNAISYCIFFASFHTPTSS
jgi:hypothetical protein